MTILLGVNSTFVMNHYDEAMLTRQELSVKIGDRIKSVRKQKGISQAELSRLCKKDKQHIELIENHKVTPNVYTLYIISDALAVELNQLLDFEI